ncbi:efflux RND transporter periplasmic adaptor subunit [Corallococcus sp. M34]|uniref:efflux RND transporter periplasmic adaptor subunit n=1 Tax=Citreicoccus inhibens TaxID=2849499 RepID=UPI001C226888|nr:efflux RND transporter periplasmic adaptor subunit [Citreicoccus inhibens]MBU8893998.1 efflux RND transporter periplasmic adaptor subunit [Citreicoccus inhibens]
MTTPETEFNPRGLAPSSPARGRRRDAVSWAVTLGGLGALFVFLLGSKPPAAASSAPLPQAGVQVTARGTLSVPTTGPFVQHLSRITARSRPLAAPLVEATGTLLATSLPLPSEGAETPWQFASSELLSSYGELLQADADVAFQERQVQAREQLEAARLRAQTESVARLRGLVEVGADSARELAGEEASLREHQLESERALHEARGALQTARRRQAVLTRQLEQVGLAPELLRQGEPGRAWLVAEVPELRLAQVREGQTTTVRFFARPEPPITANVRRILPTVSATQRTARVVIGLDAEASLRPGMFARVGLGTQQREALLIPSSAVLHVDRSDYVLVGPGAELTPTPVVLGESRGEETEILSGLSPGTSLLGDGAILLKPALVESLAVRGGER